MLTYMMDARGELSRYEYLYRCLRDDITAGDLHAHDRLPSKRSFAQHLGVSLITVEHAYRQLLAEGYIYTRERSGYFVAELPRELVHPINEVRGFGAGAQQGQRMDSSAVSPSPFLSEVFWRAHPDAAAPTSSHIPTGERIWQRALKDTLAHESDREMFGTTPLKGSLRLRSALARYVQNTRGMEVHPEQIVVCAGAPLIYTLIGFIRPDITGVALESPGYGRIAQVYTFLGREIDMLSVTPEGVSIPDLLASDAQMLHCMPSHQFPTGVVMNVATRYEILGWAAKNLARVIVEDDYDWEFRLEGRPIPALFSIDTLGSVVYISTFSKSLFPSLRIAFAVFPDAWIPKLDEALLCMNPSVSALDQLTLARMLEMGDYERHVRKLRKFARDGRDAFLDAWSEEPEAVHMRALHASAGLHIVLELSADTPVDAFITGCKDRGISLLPVDSHAHARQFMLPLGVATPEAMGLIARDMADVIHQIKR